MSFRPLLCAAFLFASFLTQAVTIVTHEGGYTASLAQHLKRWLATENVNAQLVTSAQMGKALAQEKIAFLVGFSNPTKNEMSFLRTFRARGGKLVVFYSSSPALAALMGIKPLGYTPAPYPGAWSRMNFDTRAMPGCPASIRQTSSVLQRIAPLPKRGVVIARWADRMGKSAGEPAWVATDAGWWMSHVLLADGDEREKAQLCAAICGSVNRALWNPQASAARAQKRASDLRAYALAQKPRAGEIHAVWEHSGCGLYPGNWPRTMKVLLANHVTDLFVNVAGAGFAHYKSSVLPLSGTYQQEGDQLAACLDAAWGTGIRVHAWVLCFTATRASKETLELYRKRGWLLKTADGKMSSYLNPALPQVREKLLAATSEMLTQYPGLAGIHLDFVRWYERATKPPNASRVITQFVADARLRVKKPKWLTTAVFGKYPACVANVGQDWPVWLDGNMVDYVVPMDYTNSNLKFSVYAGQQAMNRSHARRTIVGIGVTANESRLDTKQIIEQINLTRQFGLAGNALFDLDIQLETQVLPYLRLGIW